MKLKILLALRNDTLGRLYCIWGFNNLLFLPDNSKMFITSYPTIRIIYLTENSIFLKRSAQTDYGIPGISFQGKK